MAADMTGLMNALSAFETAMAQNGQGAGVSAPGGPPPSTGEASAASAGASGATTGATAQTPDTTASSAAASLTTATTELETMLQSLMSQLASSQYASAGQMMTPTTGTMVSSAV
jgi:hypothetical protein